MPTKHRVILATMLTLIAALAATSSATAATGVNVNAGAFTATSSGLKQIRTTVSGVIPIVISCNKTVRFTLTGGLFSGSGLRTVGSLTGYTLSCNPTALGTPVIRPLNLPWPIGADITRVAGTNPNGVALLIVLNVQLELLVGGTRCLFNGQLPFQIRSGSTQASLLSITWAAVSGPCSNAQVSGIGLTLSSAPTLTLLG